NAKVEELSKGNQQKVQLIGTLLHDPELIILDEPQSGLDPVNMILVRNLLRELRDQGKTILLSTHMMGEAERMADEIVLVHRGKVVLDGPLEEIRSAVGKNTVHVDYDGDGSFLQSLPHVIKSRVDINEAEITLADGADARGPQSARSHARSPGRPAADPRARVPRCARSGRAGRGEAVPLAADGREEGERRSGRRLRRACQRVHRSEREVHLLQPRL